MYWHYRTLIFLKNYAFGKTMKKCLIDLTPQAELAMQRV